MAGSRCATPSASTPTSSRATRSAASADSVDTESTHKKKQSRQKSLVARSSAAGKHASRASSVPPSPLRDAQSSEMLLDAGETSSVNNANKQKLGCSSSDEKQNICVCVRIRGGLDEEPPIWEVDEQAGRIALSENHPIIGKRKNVSEDAYEFTFDALLLPPHPTSSMYESRISQVVRAALEGYNGTIFSYGQTGSGKTHTMTGSDEEPGILPLAISDIFQWISSDTEREYLLRVSYLEIYNETLKDLLAPVKQKSLELRLTEDNRGRIVVNNIKEEIVNSPQDVLRVLTKGEDNRSVNCTDWNQRSSRSHCVFSMAKTYRDLASASLMDISQIIESRPRSAGVDYDVPVADSTAEERPIKGEVRISQLNLIDLAGSERATSHEERRKEGAFINKSLLSLSNVIHKLADEKTSGAHIPYRDSKLTRLLQTSLSGNARIAIVCTISPEARHGTESVSTLKFAQRASKVVTKAECGVVTDGSGALLANLQETIANLQAQLAKSEAQGAVAVDESALQSEMQARQKAEEEAREQRMKVIQLTDQIAHLQRQILTGAAEASDDPSSHTSHMPRTPSASSRQYGELGVGVRPAGQRGSHRRLSELALRLASPARPSGLPTSSSMRSISSALEANQPLDDEKIFQLEQQLAAVKTAAQREEQDLRKRLQESEENNRKLTEQLTTGLESRNTLEEMVQKLEQETMEKEMTIVVLREEAVACHESERHAEAEHSKNIASMQTEISDLRESIRERDEKLRLLQESQLLSSDELSNAIKSLENDLNGKREELQFSQAENMSLHEIIRTMESTEASQAAQLVAASQKAVLAETSLAERDSLIKIAEERIARLEGMLNESNQVSDTRMNKCKAEIAVLREQIQEMERQHAFEAAELNAEYRQEVAELQDALQRAKETIEQQKAIAIAHEQTASTLRAELERKEQARVRLAQLKAANTPPDFGALQAKMQAVSGRSATKSLNNSLGSSTGSQTGGAIGDSDAAVLTTLKAEVQASKSQLAAAKDVISSKDQCIQKLEQRVLDLESNIAAYRRQIDKSQALLDELDDSDVLTRKLQSMSVCSETPETNPAHTSSKVLRPLGVISPHRASISANGQSRMASGPSTPTKKDGYGYILHTKPPPLPLPPGTPEWRKQRRETRELEMSLLRSGGIASRTRTYLQSPKLENASMEWNPRSHFDNKGLANPSIRSPKSSGGSVRSHR